MEIQFTQPNYNKVVEMRNWCAQHFGSYYVGKPRNGTERWCVDHSFGNVVFYFKNDDDASFFALRWK